MGDGAGDAIRKNQARRDLGFEAPNENQGSFDQGFNAGAEASDPDRPTTARDVVGRIDYEYGPLTPDERKAYRTGYAAGANRP